MKYYRKNYIIAVYNKDDELLATLNNLTEFSEYYGIKKSNGANIIKRLWDGTVEFVRCKGERHFVYFIDLREEEL